LADDPPDAMIAARPATMSQLGFHRAEEPIDCGAASLRA
jgi:hypothetical protein